MPAAVQMQTYVLLVVVKLLRLMLEPRLKLTDVIFRLDQLHL